MSRAGKGLQQMGSISCLGESVYYDKLPPNTTDECPSIENIEKWKYEEYVSDKDTGILDLEQFRIKQSIGGFKPNTHYWYTIRNEGEIRFIAPYAEDVIDFFSQHYFIELIGHTSTMTLDEFILSYDTNEPTLKPLKYAGTFNTDENGKIKAWSNDPGHFGPSKDYAAPVAKAMGLSDVMFIPYDKYEKTDTVFYQQYTQYTGPYSAHNVVPYKDINYLKEEHGKVFYPHNYHEWYKYHGKEGHPDAIKLGPIDVNNSFVVFAIVLVALLIGVSITLATVVYGMKKNDKEKEYMSDVSEDQCESDNR